MLGDDRQFLFGSVVVPRLCLLSVSSSMPRDENRPARSPQGSRIIIFVERGSLRCRHQGLAFTGPSVDELTTTTTELDDDNDDDELDNDNGC
jgi:hypothetical protein